MNVIFPPTSRYALTPAATLVRADGTPVTYLKRRFVPPPENFALLQWHRVVQNERLDNITARYLGDPEQFWRLCDANRALRPEELTETIGKQLRITLPEGIPGVPHA
ncbi:LysM domain-containing protein [Rhodanobacter sp. T12-5]|uniref:LysM domain-containing protein n=1 Tax=Rhodanobacter sp. T12-5 TaxID=2024611 RepID=UPI0011F092CF|nr:LysM domain-containing protein [Rhodanobacter sp. T12-5]KAA0068663.1 LysM domain-containing protein [Rhodanobacter sp. T12-5]